MTALAQLLSKQIREEGSMPFADFMAVALYHPEHGYYASQRLRTGKAGDFYTSVSVGPVFGQLMASEFCGAWDRMGKPSRFTIIEAGANDGQLALDVLTWIRERRPDFLASLTYQIDEPLVSAAALQRQTLAAFPATITHHSNDPHAHGCYFANELLDAMPCHRVRFWAGHWQELRVGLDAANDFCAVEKEPEDTNLLSRLAWLGNGFPEGYTTEIAPVVASHMHLAAARLEQGYLFFADYGYPARDYYAPHRATGTLRCYRNHRAHEDPFDAIGETDLTAHVDFSLAATAAVQAGCTVLGFVDQARFLTAAAAPLLREMERSDGATASAWQRQFQTLTHPAWLGQKFHFLVLGKSVPHLARPDSLAFARPSAVADLLAGDFRRPEDDE